VQYRGLLWLERRTFRAADRVISTNESYRRVALERGGVPRERTEVVRSGPDTRRMRPVVPESDRAAGAHLLVYLGIMGPQDDVHVVLELMAELVHRRARTDVRAALLGFGDTLADLRRLCTRLDLDDVVEFTGRVGPREIGDYLSSASVGIGPDRNTPLNDASTMNKTMEYMAYAVPAVSFDLTESRFSAGETGVMVSSGDVRAFADAVEGLLDDEDRRVALSLAARERATAELDWRPQRRRYLGVFDGLLGFRSTVPSDDPPPAATDPWGRAYVDLETPGVLESFVRSRGPAR
jgi:glycosyltransferase involved in cell wall biosynthesis